MRQGMEAIAGDSPFIMKPDGKGWLFAPDGREGRPAADALRADRIAVRRICCIGAAAQSDDADL